jgi:antitoxin component YwqK of YwqJK toxin-antitoxin module
MIKHVITNHPNFEIASFKEYINDILVKEEYYNDKGELHGQYRTWHTNGQLFIERNFINGLFHGLCRIWYENGQSYNEATYKDGLRHGLYREWYSNGQLWMECTYINDKRDGLFRSWYENGQLWTEANYKDGDVVPLSYKSWTLDGKPIEKFKL